MPLPVPPLPEHPQDGLKDCPPALQSRVGRLPLGCVFEECGQKRPIGTMGGPSGAPTLCHTGPKALEPSRETPWPMTWKHPEICTLWLKGIFDVIFLLTALF